MIKQILIAAMLVAPAVYADDKTELCNTVSRVAGDSYDIAQEGIPMNDAINAAKGSEIATLIVEDAYEQPIFGTDKYKKKYRAQFQNKWFKACRGRTK